MDAMSKLDHIPRARQPKRPHFIPEWAEVRGFSKQSELANHIGADKSTVSRWYDGATPGPDWQKRLAAVFECSEDALFRHPDERWFTQFFAGRSREEIEHIKKSIEVTFPRKAS